MAAEMISVVAQASTSSSWVDAPVLRSVSESDAARLSDLLSTQAVQASAPTAAAGVPPPGGNSIGDSILRSMESAGRAYTDKTAEIVGLLGDPGNITTGDLLRVQFKLMEASLQVDLISKGVSKGVQDIDQLTKLQ